jgi:hypothetical protein
MSNPNYRKKLIEVALPLEVINIASQKETNPFLKYHQSREGEEPIMKRQTNFDIYLEEQLKDEDFAARFEKAGEAWDVALQLAALRKESGLSQKSKKHPKQVRLRQIAEAKSNYGVKN